MEQNIIEAGRLFDVFLGDALVHEKGTAYSATPIEMATNLENWNYVMEIVEKIEESKCPPWDSFNVKIQRCFCIIECNQTGKVPGVVYQTPMEYRPPDTITAVWQACANFIKWFNVQQELYAKWQEESRDQPTT